MTEQKTGQGKLFDASGRWRRQVEFDDAAVPDSVRVVMERRIQRVSRETQNVLRAAAVIGRQFELDTLEAIADVDEDALLTALEEAEGAHLIKGPSGRQDVTWRFTHQFIPQTLAQATPSIRLQRLHLRAGEALPRVQAPVLLIVGVIQLTGGFSLLAGNAYGRFIGILAGSIGAVDALLSMGGSHPFWSLAIFFLCVWIVYGLIEFDEEADRARI